MTEPVFDKVFIEVSKAGLGQKHARGAGIGFRRLEDGQIEVSIGRKTGHYWKSSNLATAWVKMNASEAHEMAHAILFLTGHELPCLGEGVKDVISKHKANLSVDIKFTVDLCSMLKNPEAIRKEIIGRLTHKLEEIKLPTEGSLG